MPERSEGGEWGRSETVALRGFGGQGGVKGEAGARYGTLPVECSGSTRMLQFMNQLTTGTVDITEHGRCVPVS